MKALIVGGMAAFLLAAPAFGAGPHGPPAAMSVPTTYPDIEYRVRDAATGGQITPGQRDAKLLSIKNLRIQEATWRAEQDGKLTKAQIKTLNKGYKLVEAGICDMDEDPDANNKCP